MKFVSLMMAFGLMASSAMAEKIGPEVVGEYQLLSAGSSRYCAKFLKVSIVTRRSAESFLTLSFSNPNGDEPDLDYDEFTLNPNVRYQIQTENSLTHTLDCPGSLGQVECWEKTYTFVPNAVLLSTLNIGGERRSSKPETCHYRKLR